MPDLCLYFQVHQPNRLLPCDILKKDVQIEHENDELNETILSKVSDNCYLPANRLFKRLIEENHGRFRIALSISGTVIEQMERFRPDVLASFQELVATGGVELLAETYYHSLAFIHSNREFDRQVELHLEKLDEVFRIRPRVFRNTELIYNNSIAAKAETMGFDGIIAVGAPQTLKDQSPNFLYRAPKTARIKTLLRNNTLSDDLGFRFSDRAWPAYPLSAEKFADWISKCDGDIVNLFLDYENIGEHQNKLTGIFDFWEAIPRTTHDAGLQWVTPTEAVDLYRASHEYSCDALTSWADTERDLSAWTGNAMQQEAIAKIHQLEAEIYEVNCPKLTEQWAKMQTSNHFYWMSTKGGADGKVHSYFMPYPSPHDAYIYFMNILSDMQRRIHDAKK